MNKQPRITQQNVIWLGNLCISKKIRGISGPGEEIVAGDIKYRRINMLKVSSIYINKKMSRQILNYYYSVENGTWSCYKSRLFQLSNNWQSKFMQCYNSNKNKQINKKSKGLEAIEVRFQHFYSSFSHMLHTHNGYSFDPKNFICKYGAFPC